MNTVAKADNPARVLLILSIAVCAVVLAPLAAQAGTIQCDGEVLSVLTYARGQSEGNVVAKVKLDSGASYVWTLCSLNEDKLVNGVATSKNGAELIAAQETYTSTCKAIFNSLHVAKSTGKKIRLAFLDNIFATCSEVPNWGGVVNVPGEDDPGERLGAWDAFYYIEVLQADVAQP